MALAEIPIAVGQADMQGIAHGLEGRRFNYARTAGLDLAATDSMASRMSPC